MRRSADYELARYREGRGYYAHVWVTVHEGNRGVLVSEQVGAWQADIHGPNAVTSVPETLERAAEQGATFALDHLARSHEKKAVTIETIKFLLVDTRPSHVFCAACRAAWRALEDDGALEFDLEGGEAIARPRP